MLARSCRAMAILVLTCSAAVSAAPVYSFANSYPEDSLGMIYIQRHMQAICKEAQIRCTIIELPLRRSQAMLANRTLDGDIGRVPGFARQSGNILVDTPVITVSTYAFTRADAPASASWEQLGAHQRSVAYRRGVYVYQKRLESMAATLRPHDVPDSVSCVEVVIRGHDDACLLDSGAITPAIKARVPPLVMQGPLEALDLYIVVNAGNEKLARTLKSAMDRLRARGVPQQLERELLRAK
ncbi:transporter substrate-binding domain-containing protein [Duganella sp. CY15W]|uniref:substrate-binding periplasmic protein n=1 Tax=Duganella sp. CY15W TaxID=2692172 RepID=UPI00136F4CBF|nr:transporter substrate-binding domain-containing protein [Duganella sp. CY15W]MYM30729.1 transporter substrate-binding domain-containing protein [Duganella sp. CY15W]